MYVYFEARIEVLKRRLTELEAENQTLRHKVLHGAHRPSMIQSVGHAWEPALAQRIAR
jgi:hypothetical protein